MVLLRGGPQLFIARPSPPCWARLCSLARPPVTPEAQTLYITSWSSRLHTPSGLVEETRERTIFVAGRHFQRLPSSIRSLSEPDPPAPVPCLLPPGSPGWTPDELIRDWCGGSPLDRLQPHVIWLISLDYTSCFTSSSTFRATANIFSYQTTYRLRHKPVRPTDSATRRSETCLSLPAQTAPTLKRATMGKTLS